MALIKTVTASELKDTLNQCEHGYYSLEGCSKIIEYYGQFNTNIELDVISIICDFTEESFDYVVQEYGYLDKITNVSDIDTFIKELNNYTYAVRTNDDYILYINF